MKRLRTRPELLIKWHFTEGRRARVNWIDGRIGARSHADRTRTKDPQPGAIRRLI